MNWLLLRGLGREKKHWFDFPEKLRCVDSQILCLDLPGFGDEKKRTPPLTVQSNAEFVRQKFLSSRTSEANWGIVGLSFGGMVALDWVHRHPQDFSKLILINSSARDVSPFLQRLSIYALYRILRSIAAKDQRIKEKEILKVISNGKGKNDALLQSMIAIASDSEVTREKILRQLWAAARYNAPDQIKIPALILASLKDAMVDVRCSKALAERLKAQIKFHPTAGHDLPLDEPEWIVQQIRDFENLQA